MDVAVVGEFNSGKSTFINALLRERLLKDAVTPTTAAATYIRRSIPRGLFAILRRRRDKFFVKFDNGAEFEFDNKHTKDITSYIKEQYGIDAMAGDVKGTIGILTAEQEVSQHVVHIDLQLANHILPPKVHIIDTPGFNPGATAFCNHMSIAREVVSDVADISIILMPSNQVMSNSLLSFLQEDSIRRYLHRCFFIITKIDCIEEFERGDVISYVKQHLLSLGINQPKIYTASARCMLPVNKIPPSLSKDWKSFQVGFKEMEQAIWKTLKRYKDVAIYEHSLNRIKDISKEISSEINANITKYQETLRILQNNTVPRIQELTDEESVQSFKNIDGFFSKMSMTPYPYIKAADAKIKSVIKSGGKLRHFRSVELPEIEQIVNDSVQDYISYINSQLRESLTIYYIQTQRFKQAFQEHYKHYKDMQALEPQKVYMSEQPIIAKVQYNLSSNDVVSRLGGIGHWLTSFAKSDNEIQDAAIRAVCLTVDSYFNDLLKKVEKRKTEIKAAQIKALHFYYKRHIELYGQMVDKLIKEQSIEKENLIKKIAILKGGNIELTNISNRIDSELKRIPY